MTSPVRALVLSGGGAKGAFQAGAISTLRHDYDIFTGISVGALNAGFLAQFDDTRKGLIPLVTMWLQTSTKDVYKKWFGSYLAALWKPSVFNSAPLRKMVYDNISKSNLKRSKKTLKVGAVEIPSGDFQLWWENDDAIIDGILASSAFPVMFPPVKMRSADGVKQYLDGGLRTVTPIADAIKVGATHIDVVMCTPRKQRRLFKGKPTTIKIALNSLDILMSEIISKDLKIAHLYNRLAAAGQTNKREISIRVINPPYELGDPLDFDPEKIQQELLLGVATANDESWVTLDNYFN